MNPIADEVAYIFRGDPSGTQEYAPHYQECLPITFHHPGSSLNAEATHHLVSSGRAWSTFGLQAMMERQATDVLVPSHFRVPACDRRTRRDTREEEQQTRQMLRGQRPLRKRSQQRFPVCLSNSDQFDCFEWPTILSEFYRLPNHRQPPMSIRAPKEQPCPI